VRSAWSARTGASRQAIQRGPSADASAVGAQRDLALLEHRQVEMPADQFVARAARQRAERVVRVGDAAGAVAPHDHVALRLEKALGALLGFLHLPGAIGEILEPQFEPLDLVALGAVAADHQGERAARRDGGAGEQRHVGMEIEARDPHAVIGDQPIERQHRERRAGDRGDSDEERQAAAGRTTRIGRAGAVVAVDPHVGRPLSRGARRRLAPRIRQESCDFLCGEWKAAAARRYG
jgi:hypothetical protein